MPPILRCKSSGAFTGRGLSQLRLECRYVSILQGDIARVLRGPNWGPKMAATTLTSREFNQDTSGAKKAARRGPVFITDRGRPDAAISPLKQGDPQLLLQMSDSAAEIGLIEGEQIRRFAEAATALRHFSVSQMFKFDRHPSARFIASKRSATRPLHKSGSPRRS
jgi:antitoxin (DNA-binding transcriptional repressor) of toxin-antitoxin stability system